MPVPLKSVIAFTSRIATRAAPLALALLLLAPAVLAAQGTEVLRGKVTGPDKKPVPGVAVEITGLVTQTVSTAITNDKGIYTALFTNAEGDYILTVRRIGFAPITTRVTRTGISSVLATDFELQPMAVVLDSITALGRKLGGVDGQPSVGGVELNALANAQFLLDPTDLLAMALTVPGVTSVGDSAFSVLGAAATSNNTTVDGTKSGATNIPQDAIASVKVITTSADVSRSGFAGGQTSVILRTGSEVFGSTIRGTFVNPTLSWADPDYPQPPATLADFSGSISGPIVKKKAHYISSWDLNSRALNSYTLLNAGPNILSQYGFTADTVNAVENALRQLNIPLSLNGAPDDQVLTRFNNTAVIDYSPSSTTSLKLTWQGQWFGYHGLGLSSQSLPTNTSKSTSTYQQLTFKGSGYVHGLLNELTESFSYGNNTSTPYSGLPGASVRIGTVFSDGTTGLGNVRFGGGSGFSQGHNFSSDLTDEVSWITSNSKHKIKVGGEFEYDWSTSYSAGNQFGNYSYLTVTDLVNNTPASFSRTLDAQQRDSKGTTTSLYVGDEWAPSKALNLQYGWRI
ncbi:MAG TPA: carboxypeptidase-like regulatory domain-containing protein, partial [Gemmatimonadales bacterium]|nr:carboxypeptidase-like regulatory domain-containing protein [Gemmatimonadales bacterium]